MLDITEDNKISPSADEKMNAFFFGGNKKEEKAIKLPQKVSTGWCFFKNSSSSYAANILS